MITPECLVPSYCGLSDTPAQIISAFGLNIRMNWWNDSYRGELPVRSEPDTRAFDLEIHLLGTRTINGEALELSKRSSFGKSLRFCREHTSLRRFSAEGLRGRAEFFLGHDGREMWVSWSDDAPVQEVLTLLFNSMLAWALRLLGRICIHASVVARNGRAIAFVAPSGIGKSTIAASLIERGYAGMTDDAAALTREGDQLVVHPGMPQLGLRNPSLEALPRFRDEIPTAIDDKRRFTLMAGSENALRFQDRALPLSAIYFLRRSTATTKPEISASKPVESLVTLMSSLYPSSNTRRRSVSA
jgi:hypothetical protein